MRKGSDIMWKRQMIHTKRGTFELFTKGDGESLCITHHYSQFNETGDYFADVLLLRIVYFSLIYEILVAL